MPKLKVSSAARAIGVPRSTLRGAISRGIVHVEEGNLVDTAELERAGYMLQPETLAIEEAGLHGRSLAQVSTTAGTQPMVGLDEAPHLFREQLAILRDELDQAHERQVQILRILEQLSRQIAKTGGSRGATVLGARPKPPMRQPILTLLQDYPHGLTCKDIETKINSPKPLQHVLQGMIRDHLLVRLKPGVFAVEPEHRVAETE